MIAIHPPPDRLEQRVGRKQPRAESVPVGLLPECHALVDEAIRRVEELASRHHRRRSIRHGREYGSRLVRTIGREPLGGQTCGMDRSGGAAALRGIVALFPGAVFVGAIGVLQALPAIHPADSGLGWLPVALAAALLVTSTLAALACLIDGLRRRSTASLLECGAWAALAGAAVAVVAGADSIAVPLAGSAALLSAAGIARRARPIADTMTARLAAVAVLVLAESLVLASLVPTAAEWLQPYERPVLAASAVLAGVAILVGAPSGRAAAGLLMAGALGLLADRNASLESIVGLTALIAAALTAAVARLDLRTIEPLADEDRLPVLAARLTDAVLRFDGSLALREWNRAAGDLLGLDADSVGVRAEDLLGVSVADLGSDDAPVLTRSAVGGLEIAMHRSGAGVTAVVRDPGARPEAERLGQELRATIEELLRARRTIDLQRGELERSATVDPLTGVSSRGAIMERLRIEVAEARRYRHPLAVVLIDVDRFTEINGGLGLAGGDAVLREVALRFRLRVREADALGRSGSDGFVAVLPHTDEAGAATFADALRHRLGRRSLAIGDALVPVTVSIGVTTMRPGEDIDVDGLLARGQEALDSARSAGGDRIALDRLHGLARLEDRREPAAEDDEEERGSVV